MKSNLKIVPEFLAAVRAEKNAKPPCAYDEKQGVKKIASLKASLLRAAVAFVNEGTSDNRSERIRRASDLSGITRYQIEAEARK